MAIQMTAARENTFLEVREVIYVALITEFL